MNLKLFLQVHYHDNDRCKEELTRRLIEADIDRHFRVYRYQACGVEFQGTLPLFVCQMRGAVDNMRRQYVEANEL